MINKKQKNNIKKTFEIYFKKILSNNEIERFCKIKNYILIMISNKNNKTMLLVKEK